MVERETKTLVSKSVKQRILVTFVVLCCLLALITIGLELIESTSLIEEEPTLLEPAAEFATPFDNPRYVEGTEETLHNNRGGGGHHSHDVTAIAHPDP
jgi:hypothetical protein